MNAEALARPVALPPFGLEGTLSLPGAARGLVLFAHGSGSSRFSPRNAFVANALRDAGLGTLLFDLLTESESADRANVFDIQLLASRLLTATDWAASDAALASLPFGYFGASTGAAAALVAAAGSERPIAAVVSRGGRPDLAGSVLAVVPSPTLLIVGGEDHDVLSLNRAAMRQLRCACELAVVPGATHLFEEPGALEQVVALAREWFITHLVPPASA
jgi:alpha-beta hydrolase superfamily lysophospholipase